MRNLEQHITQYAAYHRDRRNIATHFVGVPLLVLSVVVALAQISIGPLHGGWFGIALATIFYIALDRVLGLAMLGFLLLCGVIASLVSIKFSTGGALIVAVLLFVVGWAIQFLGHHYEGVKPAFVDDMMGLAIGPLFVMTELFFILGKKAELKRYVEARVGPTLAARNGALLSPPEIPTAANSNFPSHA